MLFWREIQKVRGNVEKKKCYTYARLGLKSRNIFSPGLSDLLWPLQNLLFEIWMAIFLYLPHVSIPHKGLVNKHFFSVLKLVFEVLKVIPLKLFYNQTFFETWRNEHSWYEHYKNAIKIWGHRACLRVSRLLKWGIFTGCALKVRITFIQN